MAVDAPPLRWMASLLYGAVMLTGLYYVGAGLAPDWSRAELAVYLAGLTALIAVEQVDWRRPRSRRWAMGVLLLRIVLLETVNAVDGAGFSRALFVLVPFFAYFWLGRSAGIGLATFYLVMAFTRAGTVSGARTDPEVVSDLFMLFIGLVLAVATAAVAVEQRRSRLQAERLVAELTATQQRVAELSAASERNRLARDIHDSVGHHLTAISVQLAKAEAFRERDPATADRAVADAHRAAARALREVRESVGTLRAEPFSLTTALFELVEGLDDPDFRVILDLGGPESHGGAESHDNPESRGGAESHNNPESHDNPESRGGPASLEERMARGGTGLPGRAGAEALYRVAQEALTNARRHADAGMVRVAVHSAGDDAVLEVEDDGRGFDPEATSGGGLSGMRERLAALGGTVRVESRPGHGTRITASVPAVSR
ncbi:sensor histidine kinase [Actinoplanes sp. CA-252034]|uniref:sensor histidine kinase n=1 Tax=Actinoplanes sp. CA-252034 TaxID=3239906 RepID=UPI003D95BE76